MTIIVCHADPRECWCCGFYAQNPIRTPSGRTYCDQECLAEWETYLAEQERKRSAAWCPTCGFDRHEHAPDCADWLAHQKERVEHPELYA